ncbi:hypothetical protein HWV62_20748 [Athelia sp. TMB]|nr:hypothetical protein HWV62_20748 [Athelia sp. TMB]
MVPEIDELEPYLERLKNAIDDFMAATALWNTRWFNKPKFHIILHIILHIRLFGPALLYATETFESYNFVIRARSIHSNRHAPSLDIARSFSHMHAIRHLVSGGYIAIGHDHDQNGRPLVHQAGREVLNLVKDQVFIKLMGMQKLVARSQHGMFTIDAKQDDQEWVHTQSGALSLPPRSLTLMSVIRQCSAAVLHDGYVLRVGAFTLFRQSRDGVLCVGRVNEILADANSKRLIGILIQEYQIGDVVLPYRFPAISPGPHQPALCSIQERQATARLENELKHSHQPHDILLNLSQLHSARLLQKMRPSTRYPNMPFEALIHRAIQNRHALEGTDGEAVSNGTLEIGPSATQPPPDVPGPVPLPQYLEYPVPEVMQQSMVPGRSAPAPRLQPPPQILSGHAGRMREMMPTLKHFSVGSIPWSPLARGILTRPLTQVSTSKRQDTDPVLGMYLKNPKDREIVGRLEEEAAHIGASMAQTALAWLMAKDGVMAPIVGTTSLANLQDLLGAVNITLKEGDIKYLDELYEPRASLMGK